MGEREGCGRSAGEGEWFSGGRKVICGFLLLQFLGSWIRFGFRVILRTVTAVLGLGRWHFPSGIANSECTGKLGFFANIVIAIAFPIRVFKDKKIEEINIKKQDRDFMKATKEIEK